MHARPDYNDPAQRPPAMRGRGQPASDLTGLRFGLLVVVRRAFAATGQYARWVCRCDCGAKTIVESRSLKQGSTCSCGCLRRQVSKRTNEERAEAAAALRALAAPAPEAKRSHAGAAGAAKRLTLDEAFADAAKRAAAKLADIRVRFDQEEAA